jgi:phenylpropionate dioxygenase-like ring-hydroxylating dioxygenase large terminal subunit
MLVTQQKIFRRFWYPVIPMDQLADGPKPFTLLDEKIVLWLAADGKPAAMIDRCGHRTAQLSCGFVENGHLVCGYHGWTYDRAGTCVRVPQAKDPARPVNFKLDAYRCVERYGYAWVALADPLTDIPEIPEADDPTFRRIPQFYEEWRCAGLRLMENSFDAAHQPFVHRTSFGDINRPQPFEWHIVFDRQVTLEDKFILESTDPDVPLDSSGERNMPSDKPGLIMRRKFLDLLHAHGETEVRHAEHSEKPRP